MVQRKRRSRNLRIESLENRRLLAATYHEYDDLFVGAGGQPGYLSQSFMPPTEEGSSRSVVIGGSGPIHSFLKFGGTLALTPDRWQTGIDLEPGSGPASFSISVNALRDLVGVPENQYWLLGARITISETLRIPGQEIEGKTSVYSLYRFATALATADAEAVGWDTVQFDPTIIGQKTYQAVHLATSSHSSAWLEPEPSSFTHQAASDAHVFEFHPQSTAGAEQISEHRYVEQASLAVSRRGHIFDRLNLFGTIIDGGPDLIGDGFAIDQASVSPGESVTVEFTVTNQGAAAAAESMSSFVISPDAAFELAADQTLATANIPALQPGESYSSQITVTLPSTTSRDSDSPHVYLGMIADSDEEVDEFEIGEANNANQGEGIDWRRLGLGRPNLAGARFVIDRFARPFRWRDTIPIDLSLANIGDGMSDPSEIAIVLSTDQDISLDSDLVLKSIDISMLDPDDQFAQTVEVTLPETRPDGFPYLGNVYLGMIADVQEEVAESDEANNRNLGRQIDWDQLAIEPVSDLLTVKVSNGLAKYNGAATDAVFRRGEREPTFEVTTAVPQADIEVSIYRDGQLVKRMDIGIDGGSGGQPATGSAVWFWDTELWDDYSQYPVGEYQVRAAVRNPDGSLALQSARQAFYVIFEKPQSISKAEEFVYLFNTEENKSYQHRDEWGIFFITDEIHTPLPDHKRFGGAGAYKYHLTPFDQRIFLDEVIDVINGATSPVDAVTLLSNKVGKRDSILSSDLDGLGGYDGNLLSVKTLLSKNYVVCADAANLLTSFLRSAGIPARPVTVDAYESATPSLDQWPYHTWTEVYVQDRSKQFDGWMASDSHEGIFAPVSRSKLGHLDSAYDRENNDVVIFALPNFAESELNDGGRSGWDISWQYNLLSGGIYEPITDREPWVFDASELYWGDPDPIPPPASPWQNPEDRFDVNGDGDTTPLDALRIINSLRDFTGGVLPLSGPNTSFHDYVDVSGDGLISAVDALLVINRLPNLDQPASEAYSNLASTPLPSNSVDQVFSRGDELWNQSQSSIAPLTAGLASLDDPADRWISDGELPAHPDSDRLF